jgi:hypothetical protein
MGSPLTMALIQTLSVTRMLCAVARTHVAFGHDLCRQHLRLVNMQQYPSAPFAQVEALLSDLIDSYQQADTASSIMATSAAVRDSIREADGAETRLKGLISGTAS